jgi:hypothetical protein
MSTKTENSVYSSLKFPGQQIRIFERQPMGDRSNIHRTFHHIQLSKCPSYIALSYTWGDKKDFRAIKLSNGKTITVRKNLRDFLYQRSTACTQAKLFWIVAIFID